MKRSKIQTKYSFKHSQKLTRQYPGRCVAVVGNKVVASGRDRIEAYEKAKKEYPKEKMGIFYIPTEGELELLVLLI